MIQKKSPGKGSQLYRLTDMLLSWAAGYFRPAAWRGAYFVSGKVKKLLNF